MYIFKPRNERIAGLVAQWQDSPFTYPEVGQTRSEQMPSGYAHDTNCIKLGVGEEVFSKAKKAVCNWKMYDVGWIDMHSWQVPIEEGQVSLTSLYFFGIHFSIIPCRIIYTIDESNSECTRFGFAFGTIAVHPEKGEEQFLVEWRHHDDSVWYHVKAFSCGGHFLTRIGYPAVRYLQKCFFRDTLKAMLRNCK